MTEQEKKLSETLRDAGCGDADIQTFLALQASGKSEEAIRLLSRHRCRLLCRMHEAQKPVDILDYLICTLKKEQPSR